MRTSDGKPSTRSTGAQYALQTNGELWSHQGEDVQAELYPVNPNLAKLLDFRALGATSNISSASNSIQDALWKDSVKQPSPRKYRETMEDGLHVVSADTDYGTITWWIDSQRDWSPVRVTLTKDGETLSESRSALKKFGDVWFPETVTIFVKGYKDGKEPYESIRVLSASFNRPEHPQKLTPNDIGVEVGTNIKRHDETLEWREIVFWDGQKTISHNEFTRRLATGELTYGPTFLRERARRQALRQQQEAAAPGAAAGNAPPVPGALAAARPVSDWERYTRDFIARHKLDEAQTQAALKILRDCQERGNAHLARHKDDFERLERARAAETAPPRVKELDEQAAKLRRPLDEIFETKLKPGLEKIPTAAQRRAAQAASQPAGGADAGEKKKGGG